MRRLFSVGVRAFATLLVAGASANALVAAETIVFGPQTYTHRPGRPVAVKKTFRVSNPVGQYVLRVVNHGVTSATVELNGRTILGPRDFTLKRGRWWRDDEWDRHSRGRDDDHNDERPVAFLARPVTLRNGTNQIDVVVLDGQPRASMTIEIVGTTSTDDVDPVITSTVQPPPNANGWNNTDVTVTFACSDSGSGVATCPAPVTVSTEGAAQVISGTAVDNAGNSATATVTLNIDKTLPALNVASPVEGAKVAALSVVVTGTATDATALSLTINGTPVALAGNSFSTQVALAAGANTIAAIAVDAAGNTTSVSRHVRVNVVPPSLVVSAPANGLVTNAANVQVQGTATPADPLDAVVVTVQGQPAVVGAGGAFSATAPLNSGTNTLTVVATDGYGLQTTRTVNVLRDTTPPVITVSGVSDGQYSNAAALTPVFSATDTNLGAVSATFDGAPFVSGTPVSAEGAHTLLVTAADLAGNQASSTVHFTLDRTPPAISIAGVSDGEIRSTPAAITYSAVDVNLATVQATLDGQPFATGGIVSAEGAHALVVSASDLAGNTATAGRSFVIDSTAPVLVLASPAEGARIAALSAAVSGTVADANSVSLSIQGIPIALAGGTFSTQVALTPGENTIAAVAVDAAGNTASVSRHVRANVLPPSLVVSTPVDGVVTSAASVQVQGTATPADLQDAVAVTVQGQPASVGAGGAFNATVPLVSGTNALTVVATDGYGLSTTRTVSVLQDTTPPAIAVSGVIDGQYSSALALTPVFSATDTNLGTISATLDGAPFVSGTPVSAEGAHTLVVNATDLAGNLASLTVHFTLDRTTPVISIVGISDGEIRSTPAAITYSAVDANLATVQATLDGQPFATGGIVSAEGSHALVVSASDLAGNMATARRSFVVDTTAPVLVVASPPEGARIAALSVAVSGTVTDPNSGSLSIQGAPVALAGGSFSTQVALTPLENSIAAVATDLAGNATTVTRHVRANVVPPALTLSAPAEGLVTGATNVLVQGTATPADPLDSVSVTVQGQAVSVGPGGSFSATVALVGGANTITAIATDGYGLQTTLTRNVIQQTAPPVVSAIPDPLPNANGWNSTPVTVRFTCSDPVSGIASCPDDRTVSTEGANQIVTGTATNRAGLTATASVTVNLDLTPPVVKLSQPTSGTTGTTVFTPSVTVTGLVSDALSGIDSATCNGVPATISAGALACVVSLTPGPNTVTATAKDRAGKTASDSLDFTYKPVPLITIASPANLSYTSISPTTVSGTVDDAGATVTINSIPATVANGAFTLALPLAEGPNIITATATSTTGAAGTASLTVTLDTTPPHVTVTSPPDQFTTTDTSVSVSGIINDIVVGTVNAEQAAVTVNGAAAQVANRTFLASNVPLALGPNIINVVGRDRVGNQATTQVTVTRTPPAAVSKIQLVSGNGQSGAIRSLLPAPLVVGLTDGAGNPVPNKPVIFKVTQNDGVLATGGGDPAPTLISTTDALGRAHAEWRLGGRAGAGGNTVEVYSVGFDGTAIFTASGNQGSAGKIVVDTGNNQIGPIGQRLPKPFIAVVVDEGNNRLGGVPVTFNVAEGGGDFDGQPSLTVTSDPDGRVAATLTLGTQEGNNNNLVSATFEGNQSFPASFTASGRFAGDPAKTSVTGVVLDNSNQPIPGVTVRAVQTEVLHANGNAANGVTPVQTDAQGQFTIPQAPVGFVKLLVDGTTAPPAGTFPTLEYDMVTVAGQANTVGQPIFLLALNSANSLCVQDGTGGGTLTIPDAPGFSLTFAPGQVTFPGGSKNGCITVTSVHPDKVPMAPGFGQQPRFIVTIQPSGAIFNPPAPITLPNVDGLKPREVTEMYSFDHDISSFVAIGTGTVSDDGLVIRSDAGVGVLKAGWHCGGDPAARGSVADCPPCKFCQAAAPTVGTPGPDQCVPDPGQAGKACSSPFNNCYAGGTCGGTSTSPTGTCAGGTPLTGTACNPGGGNTGICDNGTCLGSGACAAQCLPASPNECMVYCNNATCTPPTPVPNYLHKSCTTSGAAGFCVDGACAPPVTSCSGQNLGAACTLTGGGSGTCDSQQQCQPWAQSCAGQGVGTLCWAGGTTPGQCDANQLCAGSGNQCPATCNGGTCINGMCSGPLQVTNSPASIQINMSSVTLNSQSVPKKQASVSTSVMLNGTPVSNAVLSYSPATPSTVSIISANSPPVTGADGKAQVTINSTDISGRTTVAVTATSPFGSGTGNLDVVTAWVGTCYYSPWELDKVEFPDGRDNASDLSYPITKNFGGTDVCVSANGASTGICQAGTGVTYVDNPSNLNGRWRKDFLLKVNREGTGVDRNLRQIHWNVVNGSHSFSDVGGYTSGTPNIRGGSGEILTPGQSVAADDGIAFGTQYTAQDPSTGATTQVRVSDHFGSGSGHDLYHLDFYLGVISSIAGAVPGQGGHAACASWGQPAYGLINSKLFLVK